MKNFAGEFTRQLPLVGSVLAANHFQRLDRIAVHDDTGEAQCVAAPVLGDGRFFLGIQCN